MAQQMTKKRRRVGIDFGGTIATLGGHSHAPMPHAISMVRHLVGKFGAPNVFIVSTAKQGMEQRTREWLEATSFYEITGMLRQNTIFVRKCREKRDVAKKLCLNIFFDDSVTAVRHLMDLRDMERIFWMYAKPCDIGLLHQRNREGKVSIATKGWPRTMKYLQKIPRYDIE